MTLYHLAQIQVFCGGVVAITLITGGRTWSGFIVGLANQVGWQFIAYHDAAWGVMAINIVYGAAYVRGLVRLRRLRREGIT